MTTPDHPGIPSLPLPVPARGFVSTSPAQTWEEGLICGNGTIGANALSRPLDERIVFTHERLFLPNGMPVMPPDAGVRLFEIRRLIDRGLYKQATELAFAFSGQDGFMYPDAFVPAFDLSIRTEPDGEIGNYARSVDFQTGEATVHWTDARGTFERRLFVSRRDGVAVLAIDGPEDGGVNCRLAMGPRQLSEKLDEKQRERSQTVFESHVKDIETSATESSLSFRCRFTKAYPGSIRTIEALARVEADGGTYTPDADGGLTVAGAKRVLLLIDIQPVYDPDASAMDAMSAALSELGTDYDELLQGHAELHGELFNRMRLDLGGGTDHLFPTEELLANSEADGVDPALIEKEFDAGRYNIISCTGELPPTLQGVWGGTYVPGWASDFTHNGNVPSAIAANLMGNMPELMLAYTSYIESIVPWLEINAKHMFGARGVVLPSRSTTHGFNNALNPNFAGGFWVGGAGWAAHFFYDYYLYTGDRAFLADHALPFMEKALLFFEDYLYEGPDGKVVFSPTQSPENTPANSNSQGSFNATMDVAVARELLQNTIAASRELGRNEDKLALWENMLTKLPEYMVDENGIIKEWLTPRLQNNDSHRHSSQLYALYDDMPDEIVLDPVLREGFKRSIEFKLDKHWRGNQRGFMSFGLVQLGLAAASLGEGELCFHCLTHLVNRFWLTNLASMHNHRSLFNMDISGGMPAVIIKMLAASEPGRLWLLPALPSAWQTGAIEGVLCRGEIEIKSLSWEPDGVAVTLVSGKSQAIELVLPREIAGVAVTGAQAAVSDTESPCRKRITLPAGQTVSIDIRLACCI